MEVKTSSKNQRKHASFRDAYAPFPENFAHFNFFEPCSHHDDKVSQVTILLGQNGTGKSRLMRDIIAIFNLVELNKKTVPMVQARVNCVKYIKYRCNGSIFEIHVNEDREISGSVNRQDSSLADILLPSRLIASSSSPFDKFPYPRTSRQSEVNKKTDNAYAYLGLKDRSGRASGSRALMNTIANLAEIESKEDTRNSAISEVFKFLGYRPTLNLVYTFSGSPERYASFFKSEVFENDSYGNFSEKSLRYPYRDLEYIGSEQGSYFNAVPESQVRKIATQLRIQSFTKYQLVKAYEDVVKNLTSPRTVHVGLNFETYRDRNHIFDQIQVLRKAGILRLKNVESYRIEGGKLDFKDVSSGEFAIALGIIGIASVIENGSVIFIDEPEISLHPAWQDKYLELLMKSFSSFTGCHFILATHSPLILSDVDPKISNIVMMGTEHEHEAKDISGASADKLLLNVFEVTTENNSYLQQQLSIALALIGEGKYNTDEFFEISEELNNVVGNMDKNNRAYGLIESILSVAAGAGLR